jgi:hypothetical protein
VEAHNAAQGTGAPSEKTLSAEGPLAGGAALREDQTTLEHPVPNSADAGGVERSPSPLWPVPGVPPGGNQGEPETGRRSRESPVTGEESIDVRPVLPAPPSDLLQRLLARRAALQRSLDECVGDLVFKSQALALERELLREEWLEFKKA